MHGGSVAVTNERLVFSSSSSLLSPTLPALLKPGDKMRGAAVPSAEVGEGVGVVRVPAWGSWRMVWLLGSSPQLCANRPGAGRRERGLLLVVCLGAA